MSDEWEGPSFQGSDLYAVWRASVISVFEARRHADSERVHDQVPEWEHLEPAEQAGWATVAAMVEWR